MKPVSQSELNPPFGQKELANGPAAYWQQNGVTLLGRDAACLETAVELEKGIKGLLTAQQKSGGAATSPRLGGMITALGENYTRAGISFTDDSGDSVLDDQITGRPLADKFVAAYRASIAEPQLG